MPRSGYPALVPFRYIGTVRQYHAKAFLSVNLKPLWDILAI
jgi:uncharacterized protein with HEPN domain